MLKSLTPIFIENSRVPVWLSKIAPIEIGAINLGIFVWCRGEVGETTRRHECIHFQQQIECFFVGFLILYGWYWMKGYLRHGNGRKAYYDIPFERESYDCEDEEDYLEKRKRYAWNNYIGRPLP